MSPPCSREYKNGVNSTSVTSLLLLCLPCVWTFNLIMSKNYLSKNDELRKGDYLMSNNGNFKAMFQEDGNFVLYGWSPLWASDTCGSDGVRVCMQADCNLVMYNQQSEARWHTNSAKDAGSMCRLHLTNDGKLLVDKESVEIWNSDKSEGKK
ncbi:B-type lectin plumieribetin-like [Pseudoliparis swirei]|uniref:B-type lectin plumieribetin-like n=1 Tax=Pseudoliparis swirei TaxID=2059687 RepID=UPI0024BEEB2F|nr:B-type lectin plumieribetin-like [Pseudoliparis swirei]